MMFPGLEIWLYAIVLILLWIGYLYVSDFLVYYYFKAKKINLDLHQELIINNFSFRNKKVYVNPLFSDISPALCRVSLFRKGDVIINKKFISTLSDNELKAFLDMELSYYGSISGFLEVLASKLFFLIMFTPIRLFRGIAPPLIVRFFLSPFYITFRYIIKNLRRHYTYKGIYENELAQVIFKVKLAKSYDEKLKIFFASENSIDLILKGDRKKELIDTSRFEVSGI
jgi:hypothetical protein